MTGIRTMRGNIKIMAINYFFWGLWPLNAVAILYFNSITQSYANAMMVFSIYSISKTFAEIPTGIFADRCGRKKDIICGCLTEMTAFILFAAAGVRGTPAMLMAGGVLWGIGEAFFSGTNEALIYETAQELKEENKFNYYFSRINVFYRLGTSTGALLTAIIVLFMPLSAIAWISVIPPFGQLITAFMYKEPKRINAENLKKRKISSFNMFRIAARNLFRNRKLRFFSFLEILDNSMSQGCHQFESAYFKTLVGNSMISVIRFTKQMWAMFSYLFTPKVKKHVPSPVMYLLSLGWNSGIRVIGLMLNNIISPFLMASVNLSLGTQMTGYQDILQHEFTAKERSTMMSTIQFFAGIFLGIAYYLIGLSADLYSPRVTLAIIICFKGSLFIISMFNFIRKKRKHVL